MAWGDRKGTRVTFDHSVKALMMSIDGTWRRECKLADVSVSGARLIPCGPIDGLNLKEFFLLLTPTGLAFRRCELIRVNGDEIGVQFLKKTVVRGKRANQPGSMTKADTTE